jgi:molybdopterin synthase sulfur carrier subunit
MRTMPKVSFTPALERFLSAPSVEVKAATLGQALAAVFTSKPALRGYLLDDQGALRRHVVVYVNGWPAKDRTQLSDPVLPRDEIYVFQALTGG